MQQNKKQEQQERKPKLKSPLKPTLMLSNDLGWQKPLRLTENQLAEIFAQLREDLVPAELKTKKIRK